MVVAVLVLMSLSGCGLFQGDGKQQELERLLDENAEIAVMIDADATADEKTGVEARLKELPGVTAVSFEDQETAYAKAKKLWAEQNQPFPASVTPETLPESFIVHFTDQAAVREVRDSPLQAELKELPGVVDLVIRCTTIDECRVQMSPAPVVSQPR